MPYTLKLDVDPSLLETAASFDEATLSELCSDEMDNHIKYLETLVKGWKTFRHATPGHSRLLFLILMSQNKQPLHDYERHVLFPKMLERLESAEADSSSNQNPTPPNGAVTTSTTVSLGAKTTEPSAEVPKESTRGASATVTMEQSRKALADGLKEEFCGASSAVAEKASREAPVAVPKEKLSGQLSPAEKDKSPTLMHQKEPSTTSVLGSTMESSEANVVSNTICSTRQRPQSLPRWRWIVRENKNTSDPTPNTGAMEASETKLAVEQISSGQVHTGTTKKQQVKLSSAEQPPNRSTSITRSITKTLARDNGPQSFEMKPLSSRKSAENKDQGPNNVVHKDDGIPLSPRNNDLIEEDMTVQGVQGNRYVAGNILVAAAAVRNLLEDVNINRGDATDTTRALSLQGNQATREGLMTLESQLLQSVGLEPLPKRPVMGAVRQVDENGVRLSRAARKRAYKTAKKTFEIADREWRAHQQKTVNQQQAVLAAEALATLTKTSTSSDDLSQNVVSNVPLTVRELQKFVQITESGNRDFEKGSEESDIISKVNANIGALALGISEKMRKEQENNRSMIQEMESITKQLGGFAELNGFSESTEEKLRAARRYIIEKLEHWRKEECDKSKQYVTMYEHILRNCTPQVADAILAYRKYENVPSIKFEETMLQKYNQGEFPGNEEELSL